MYYQESKNFTHSLSNFKNPHLEFAESEKSVEKENHSVFEMENEECLQEKILTLYDQIEHKTIINIEIKNKNQILEAKIDAYLAIIRKMEAISSNTIFCHGSKRESGNHQKKDSQAHFGNEIKKVYGQETFEKNSLECFELPLESKNFEKVEKNSSILKNKVLNFEDTETGKERGEYEKSFSKKSEGHISNNTKPSLFYLSNLKEPEYFEQENYKSPKNMHKKSSSYSNLLSKRYSEIDIDKLWDNTNICRANLFGDSKNKRKDELKKYNFLDMNKKMVEKKSKR